MTGLRIISGLCLIYFLLLVAIRGGKGSQWLWLGMGLVSGILSIRPIGKWFFSNKWVNIFMGLCIAFFLIVELVILINSVDSKATGDKDFLIVLGAGVRGTIPSLVLRNRLDKAYEYLLDHETTIAVLTGGQGSGEDITEALAMKNYLIKKGLLEERIIMEDQATDTFQNIRYSFKIIDQIKPNASVGLVTTRFHLFRSKVIAQRNGKIVSGYGSENYWPLVPHYYLREFFGVMKDLVL